MSDTYTPPWDLRNYPAGTEEDLADRIKLRRQEGWDGEPIKAILHDAKRYRSERTGVEAIWGIPEGHPSITGWMRTSAIAAEVEHPEGTLIVTLNSVYLVKGGIEG